MQKGLIVLVIFFISEVICGDPVHVHLAYGAQDDQMQVTFASSTSCGNMNAHVVYGTMSTSLSGNVVASETLFEDGNGSGHKFIYNALLTKLTAGQKYYYMCTCGGKNSTLFHFSGKLTGNQWVPNLVIFGDMGRTDGPQALPGLVNEVKNGWPHVAIHIGDFAYDMNDQGGHIGDVFMDQIQDIAAYIPYMVAVGNHEPAFNYSHYRNRFNMPNTDDNMYFSWDVSTVHFIAYSSEVYFNEKQYPAWTIEKQLQWLEQDLIKANARRDVTPWIIAYGHQPMYCSNKDGDDCTKDLSLVRQGLETLFFKYGVDMILEAHEHSYERLWPVFNKVVTQKDYNNPKAPVHIITGCAGCNEDLGVCVNGISEPQGPWSAFQASGKSVYGYGRMQVHNATHLYWEELEVKENNKILDSIWLVQHNHGPFAPLQ
jgi:hypothetical protein